MTESVAHQFPHPELSPLQTNDEKPNNASLKLLHKELNANAMSISSLRGSGQHGHLALTVPAATYLHLATAAFINPTHPGQAPVHVANATGNQITETNRQFNSDLKEFQIFTSVEASLRKQLIAAVPTTFIDELSDDVLGYANTTTLALLTHLDTTYGTITSDDLDKNLADLHRAWSTEQPIEDLWKQLRACIVFAHAIDPISEATAVRAATQNLEKTGVFTVAIKDWRKLTPNQHTIAQLKTHFNQADKERHRNLTSRDAGFAGAATRPATQPNSEPNPNPLPNLCPLPASPLSRFHYCWSHGLGPNVRHTSQTCRAQAPGHRPTATVNNMLGGCNLIHRRRGEEPLYQPPPPRPPA
jgi:hypothetical protein